MVNSETDDAVDSTREEFFPTTRRGFLQTTTGVTGLTAFGAMELRTQKSTIQIILLTIRLHSVLPLVTHSPIPSYFGPVSLRTH